MMYECYHEGHIFDESQIQEYTHDGHVKCPFCDSYAEPVDDPEEADDEEVSSHEDDGESSENDD